MDFEIERLGNGPIIAPDMDARVGTNINGTSLIRAPDWLANPLGRYYLYFAHHNGSYIRLAVADTVEGPWRTHEDGKFSIWRTVISSTTSPRRRFISTTQRSRSVSIFTAAPVTSLTADKFKERGSRNRVTV